MERSLDVLDIAKKLISTPSVSGMERNIAYLIKDLLSEAGVDRAYIDQYGNVIGVVEGSIREGIVFEGHMDHVPPGDLKQWSHDPYDPVVVDDKLYGRGATDMKGAIAAMIASIQDLGEGLEHSIYYVFVPHEEICEGVLFGRALDETLGLKPRLVVLGEATNLDLYRGQRGRTVIEINVIGRSAHASMPWEGINPLKPLAKLIIRLDEVMNKLPGHPVLGGSTLSPTVINCSPGFPPMIPDHCRLLLDARFPIQVKRANLLNALRSELEALHDMYIDSSLEILREDIVTWTGKRISVEHFYPSWLIPVEEVKPLLNKLLAINPSMKTGIWRFSTDGVYSAGVKGYLTIGIGPGDERLAHKPDEYIPVKDLYRAVEIYSLIPSILS